MYILLTILLLDTNDVRSTVILIRIQQNIVVRNRAATIFADVTTSLPLLAAAADGGDDGVLLRYERYTITTLLRRRDGLIILVVAVSHRIRLEILVGHHRRRLDSMGYNCVLCITRRPNLIEPKISPISSLWLVIAFHFFFVGGSDGAISIVFYVVTARNNRVRRRPPSCCR